MTTKGRLLVATPAMMDDNFDRTVILVVEHTVDGALGVVLNRPGGVAVGHVLDRWAPLATHPAVLYIGGPVEREAILALGAYADPEPGSDAGGTMVVGSIGVVDLSREPDEVATELIGLRLFSGYSGWGPGQLEEELDAGGWMILDADPTDVLTDEAEALWPGVLGRQPDPALRRLTLYPADLNAN